MWVSIPPGSKGDCARCSKAPAVQGVNQQLLGPIPAKPEFNLPEVWSIRIYVCQACLEPDDVLTEDEPEDRNTSDNRQLLAEKMGYDMDLNDLLEFYIEEMADRMKCWPQSEFDELWGSAFEDATDVEAPEEEEGVTP